MPLAPDKLVKLLRGGDPAAVQRFFEGAAESDRRAVAPQVIAWCQRLDLHWQQQFNKKAAAEIQRTGAIENWRSLLPAAHLAALACAVPHEIRSLAHYAAVPVEACAVVLADRRPSWADEYAELLCEGELHTFGGNWKHVRALIKAGVCQPPRHQNYVLEALNCIWPRFEKGGNWPPLADLLLQERDWLERDFWRLFELDGNGEVSLASCEKYRKSKETWTDAILELSQRGVLSRERLLDCSLAALSRDFIQFRASWFSRFHEALEPTPAERVARVDAYLHLLGSSIPPTVAFAVDAVAIVDKNKPLPATVLAGALPPALNARGKAVVRTALKVLEAAAKREPQAKMAVCGVVVTALLHEAADVQKAVFDFLDRHGDRQDVHLVEKLREVRGAVAASLKSRLQPWLGDPPVETTAAVEVASPGESQWVASRIDPTRALVPIDDLDDLIHAASAMLEEPSDPNEIERVLDGICRLCDQRPADFEKRTGPLLKRARKKRGTPAAVLDRGLAMFLIAWIEGTDASSEAPKALGHGWNQYAFLFHRLGLMARHVQTHQATPLLSAPTHAGGWIEPRVLVERWLAWQRSGVEMASHEQVLALLRMAPEGRDEARAAAKAAEGDAGEALQFALGETIKTGRNPSLWLAAWRSRQPFGDLPEFEAKYPGLGPDAGIGAKYEWSAEGQWRHSGDVKWTNLELAMRMEPQPPKAVVSDLLPVLFHRMWEVGEEGATCLMRWATHLWPANREAMFFRGAKRLETSVVYADVSDREFCAYVEPLADAHTELRPMACLALALSLAAQDAALRGHAQDALIAAIGEGRLNVEELGGTMARLLDTGLSKFVRWAKGLREVGRVSPRHAQAVGDLIARALHGDPACAPRDVSALLEVLFELRSEIGGGLNDARAREYLAGLTAGGKTGKLVKQILAL